MSRHVLRALLLALAFQMAIGAALECVASCEDEDGGRDCATVCCRAASPFVVGVASTTVILDRVGSVSEGAAPSDSAVLAREILHVPKPTLT